MADAVASPVFPAARVALASALCFTVSSIFHLDLAYQSLITVHIVNYNSPQGPFQRGIERLFGRVVGVLYGAVLVVTLGYAPGLMLTAMVVFQLMVWYLNAADRLAYTGIHLGIFSATTAATGLFETPHVAVHLAIATATQIVLGVFVTELVNALAADTGPLRINTGSNPIFPLRKAWVIASIRVTGAGLGGLFVARFLDLPIVPTMISAMLITQAGDPVAVEWKAYLRMLGAVGGVLYCLPVLHIIAKAPSLGLLLGFIFVGIFIGQLLAKRSTKYAYLGFQFGLSVGLVLAGKPAEISDLNAGLQRIVGVTAGVAIALVAVVVLPTPKPAS